MKHVHKFELYVGIPVFARRATAWIRRSSISEYARPSITMFRCACGEQGYNITGVGAGTLP